MVTRSAVSPHDINGFLNIQRLNVNEESNDDYDVNGSWNVQNCNIRNTPKNLWPEGDTCFDINEDDDDLVFMDVLANNPNTGQRCSTEKTLMSVWTSKGKASHNDKNASNLLLLLRGYDVYKRKFDDKKTVKVVLWEKLRQR